MGAWLFTFYLQSFSFCGVMTQAKVKIRLYVPEPFAGTQELQLSEAQSHYVANVMRAQLGDLVSVFNGQDGQWLAEVSQVKKKSVTLQLQARQLAQKSSPDLWLVFAPVKNKTELVVEKATELGVSKILAVFTRYSVVRSINQEKLETHAIEAAEQCERMDVPPIEEHKDLQSLLAAWPKDRTLLYGDESGNGLPMTQLLPTLVGKPCAVLIGPEGGFSKEEHQLLMNTSFVKGFGLGPRILRADTAAVAALACVQSMLGDWQEAPHFESEAS